MIHLLESTVPAGSKFRKSVAKCGESTLHGQTESCPNIVAWWSSVTCPVCKIAGQDSVAFLRAAQAEAAKAAEAKATAESVEGLDLDGTDAQGDTSATDEVPSPAKPKRQRKPKPAAPAPDPVSEPGAEQEAELAPVRIEEPTPSGASGPADASPSPGLDAVAAGEERTFLQPGSVCRWPCPEPDDADYQYVLARANEMAQTLPVADAIEWAVNYAWGAAALNEAVAAAADPASAADKAAWTSLTTPTLETR